MAGCGLFLCEVVESVVFEEVIVVWACLYMGCSGFVLWRLRIGIDGICWEVFGVSLL